jgi:nucleoside-diphosphate-sugar epimerase
LSTILVAEVVGCIGSMVSREMLARGHRVVVEDALLSARAGDPQRAAGRAEGART